MAFLFWIFIFFIFYCYFGYPICLMFLAKIKEKKVHKGYYEPCVSILISVWNEEDVIARKIDNLLSLDYPPDKIEILIGSDGSDDKTNEIVRGYSDKRITLVCFDDRRGKMTTLNELVTRAKNDAIVFTDARQMFAPEALKELVSNFNDHEIGCVSGELILSEKEGGTAKGINLYWNYEKLIRANESKIHSMLGATGAIYAIRKRLFVSIPPEIVLDDMFIPLKIIAQGYRAVYDDKAKAFDEVAEDSSEEYRRKVRTLFGNYQLFKFIKNAFNPFSSPIAIQLFSHKYLRLLIPFFMIAVFFINAALVHSEFYRVVFVLQIIFYGLASLGGLAKAKKYGIFKSILKVCYVPYVFCLLNFSALVGFLRFIFNKQTVTWEKARGKFT